MAQSETLLAFLSEHLGAQNLVIPTLLICALIVTYCWSILGTKLKLAICFSIGVLLFKILFDQLIDERLFPDLHSYLPFVLGGITAGLLETGALLLANRPMVIGIFFGGAIVPTVCFARTSHFYIAGDLIAPLLTAAAAIVLFCGLAMLKITRTKPYQLIISSIAGGIGVAYFSGFTGVASNGQLSGIDGFQVISAALRNNRLPGAICLAMSGLIVQSVLHLAYHHIHRSKQNRTRRLQLHK